MALTVVAVAVACATWFAFSKRLEQVRASTPGPALPPTFSRRDALIAAGASAGMGPFIVEQADAAGRQELTARRCMDTYASTLCSMTAAVPTAWKKQVRREKEMRGQWGLEAGTSAVVSLYRLEAGDEGELCEGTLNTWVNQFTAEGRSVVRTGEFDPEEGKELNIKVVGSWNGLDGQSPPQDDYEMLVTMVAAAPPNPDYDEEWYAYIVKAWGPRKVVEANSGSLANFVKSIQPIVPKKSSK